MLKNDYKYIVTKLYPETITDPKKQEKIFTELLATFQENTVKKVKKVTDTSKEELVKYKKILKKLIDILQKQAPKGVEIIIPDLKKLEQNSNVTLIQQELKSVLKRFSTSKEDIVLLQEIKNLMKEMGMFVMPEFIVHVLDKISQFSTTLTPLIHPSEMRTQKHIVHENNSETAIEYETIQNNSHIHTFLRKKYRSKFANFFQANIKKYYIYTLLREKK
ncbi:hypothetical protein H6768_04610 [Candidatus Peribacteria bacterium]|nr:hypothetical protein [Candidatus Peribacteria bacterium]